MTLNRVNRAERVKLLLAGFLAVWFLAAATVWAQAPTAETIEAISKRFAYFISLEPVNGAPRYIYADSRQHVHLFEVQKGTSRLVWETVNLGGRATALLLRDLDKDGRDEIVISTTNGRILIYDSKEFDLLWENLQDRFESVGTLTAENIDRDPQDELIFVANGLLYIYDSVTKTIEWQSTRRYEAKEILLANMDDDEQLELILNTGFVIDTRFYRVEYEAQDRFGDRISLLDTNGDGIPEVIGETTDFTIRVYDIYAERELW